MAQEIRFSRPLTEDQLRRVTIFAEAIYACREESDEGLNPDRIDTEALCSKVAQVGGEPTDVALVREYWTGTRLARERD